MMALNVSRETSADLAAFADLVAKWSPKINLIAKSTASDIWQRHIVDSMQIYPLVPEGGHWVDIGSGGGFPGIVAAILCKGNVAETRFTLIESDQRKAVFLRTVVRELNLNVKVVAERAENLPSLQCDVLSARALSHLTDLLSFAEKHLADRGIALFLKGALHLEEIEEAQKHWRFSVEIIKSETNAEAAVLKIKDISRV